MKSLIITLSLSALTFAAQAQKCKYDVDKADPFTKEMVQSTTLKIGPETINGKKNHGGGWGKFVNGRKVYAAEWTMTFEKNGKGKFIAFEVIVFGKFDESAEPGQKVYLRLGNDRIIELVAEKQAMPTYTNVMAVFTHYDLRFKVDDGTLQQLSEAPVTNFKMQLDEREITAEIDNGKGEKIMKIASCFK